MTIFLYCGIRSRSLCNHRHFTVTVKNIGTKTRTPEPEILFEYAGTAGLITLNRPKFNLIDYGMVAQMSPILQAWERTKSHVIIKGAGGTFSAGGNLKWLLTPDHRPTKYVSYTTEVNNSYRISKYRIPFIALMDGISMGAALMLVAHARYKIVTERTVVSMPEARIGWCAAAPHFLPRLSNHLGFYMALTGKRMEGKDAVLSGLATHFIPSVRLHELQSELCNCNPAEIEDHLNAYSEPLGEFSFDPVVKDIDYCFSADTVEEIIERLSKLNTEWSRETIKMMRPLCPIMLKVILRALQLGRNCDLKEAFRMEQCVVFRCIGSYNAEEGLRSLLVEKTDRPNWRPRTLAEVTDGMVNSYFESLPVEEEVKFFDEYI